MANAPYIPWKNGQFWCLQCKTALPLEMRHENTPHCGACWTMLENQKNTQTVDNALVLAANQFMSNPFGQRGSVRADVAMSAFVEGLGGENLFGKNLAAQFNRITSDPMVSAKELRIWYFQTVKFLQKQQELDKDRQPDLSDIPEEDLFAMMRPIAAQMLMENPEFRAQVLEQAGIRTIDAEAHELSYALEVSND